MCIERLRGGILFCPNMAASKAARSLEDPGAPFLDGEAGGLSRHSEPAIFASFIACSAILCYTYEWSSPSNRATLTT